MNRREGLAAAAAMAAAGWCGAAAARADTAILLAAAWRGPAADDPQHVGALRVQLAQRRVEIAWSHRLPSRAHGLLVLPDGGLIVLAARPGPWLWRLDARGTPIAQHRLDDEADRHRLDGHAVLGADGQWLFTTQTDAQGQGWLAVRDPHTLHEVDRWQTHGVDPHHLLLHPAGADLMIANGGIRRDREGRKRELDTMDSSLVRLNARDGRLRGQWRLADRRSSLRHLAWTRPAAGDVGSTPVLGVALQAEHDTAAERARAPLLAILDEAAPGGGASLEPVFGAIQDAGYAGDVCALGENLLLSAQRGGRGLLWSPRWPQHLRAFAEVTDPCALASPVQGDERGTALLAAGTGLAAWHAERAPLMLRWPQPMAPDNHWVVLPPVG